MREQIILSSKGLIPGYCESLYPGGARINPESIHKAIDGSLRRLRTDYLDIWMFHRDDPSLPVGPLVDTLDGDAFGCDLDPFRFKQNIAGELCHF